MGSTSTTGSNSDPLVSSGDVTAVNGSVEQLIAGEAVKPLIVLDPKDPTVQKLLAAIYDANDSTVALGQRVLSLQAEIDGLRGDIAGLKQQRGFQPAPPQASPPPPAHTQTSPSAVGWGHCDHCQALIGPGQVHQCGGNTYPVPTQTTQPSAFRPTHYSQIEPLSDADLKAQIKRWLEGR